METRTLTCIGCPLGCEITVSLQGGEVTGITGNTCKRGAEYARNEVTNPMRTVTSTVCVQDGMIPVVSVRTKGDIPKEKIGDCMKALKDVTIKAPVQIGDVVLPNVGDTGVDVVATKAVDVAGV